MGAALVGDQRVPPPVPPPELLEPLELELAPAPLDPLELDPPTPLELAPPPLEPDVTAPLELAVPPLLVPDALPPLEPDPLPLDPLELDRPTPPELEPLDPLDPDWAASELAPPPSPDPPSVLDGCGVSNPPVGLEEQPTEATSKERGNVTRRTSSAVMARSLMANDIPSIASRNLLEIKKGDHWPLHSP